MLVPNQWRRIVGSLVAAAVLLFLFKGFHDHHSLRDVFRLPANNFAASRPSPSTSNSPTPSEFISPPEALEPADVPAAPIATALQADDVKIASPTNVLENQPTGFGLPTDLLVPQRPLTAATSPSALMNTPTPSAVLRKTIIMGKVSSENTEWVGQEMADWEHAIYVVDLPEDVDSPTGLRTKINKANEATPYLTYIIENYANLPDIAVFLHAHRKSWHNDGPMWDSVSMLRGLHLSVVEERGFVNLRCMGSPGCPNEIQLNRFPVNENLTAEIAFPYVYGEYFNMTVEEVRQQVPIVATPCCAQFAVSRAQILQRPKSDYERLLKLIEDSDIESHVLGTVLEYMWHILFGKDPVHCEQEQACRAALYGYGNPGDWS